MSHAIQILRLIKGREIPFLIILAASGDCARRKIYPRAMARVVSILWAPHCQSFQLSSRHPSIGTKGS